MLGKVIVPCGEAVGRFALDYLRDHGYSDICHDYGFDAALSRIFSVERVDLVLRTGTDRDKDSDLYFEDELALRKLRLGPEDIIYLGHLSKEIRPLEFDQALSVYDPNKVVMLEGTGSLSYTPKRGLNFLDALVGVFVSEI